MTIAPVPCCARPVSLLSTLLDRSLDAGVGKQIEIWLLASESAKFKLTQDAYAPGLSLVALGRYNRATGFSGFTSAAEQ